MPAAHKITVQIRSNGILRKASTPPSYRNKQLRAKEIVCKYIDDVYWAQSEYGDGEHTAQQSLYRLRDSGKFEKLSVKLDKAKAEETIAKLDLDNLNTPYYFRPLALFSQTIGHTFEAHRNKRFWKNRDGRQRFGRRRHG